MPVHYIHVEHRRAAALDGANPLPKAREVRGEDGRSNLDGIGHNFSAVILPDSRFSWHRAGARNEKSPGDSL
jgi:hypothetical protein